MHASRPRATHHSHHSSLTHFDDIKVLQAEIARQSQADFIEAPVRSISSAQSTPQVAPKQALATIASRPHSSARLVPATWNPAFLDKPAAYKRWLICHPSHYPVCTLHLAAIAIQRWWRRLGRLRRTKRSRRRVEHVPTWEHPWKRLARDINAQPHTQGRGTAEAASGSGDSGSVVGRQQSLQNAVSLNDHCASVIQRAWRASRERRQGRYLRRPMYRIAAVSIQRWWRERLIELGRRRSARAMAAVTIQRAYRRHCDHKIYRFFRQLLLSRQNANPVLLLRTLQAREQTLADSASGLYVRLRLGGASFPPLIYYKVFTTQHVLDVNSFAPRDYALDDRRRREARKARLQHRDDGGEDRTDVQYWYRRWENNGWRVVGGQLLLEHRDDDTETRTAAVTTYHHPNKLVRRGEAERRRRERRVDWMKQMYAQGRHSEASSEQKPQQEEAKEMMDVLEVTHAMDALIGQTKTDRRRLEEEAVSRAAAAAASAEDGDEEEDVESLVDWASQLCFDEYEQQWKRAGATRSAQRYNSAR